MEQKISKKLALASAEKYAALDAEAVTGILGYNSSNDRYGLLVMDLWEIDGFHCGDTLEVWDSDKEQWIATRMEMHWQAPSFPPKRNDGWYLVGTSFSGMALEGLKVRVQENIPPHTLRAAPYDVYEL